MTCRDCLIAATDWTWGGLRADCSGCTVRDLANSPPIIQRAEYLRVAALSGRDEAVRLRDAVRAEAARVAGLRAASMENA